MCLQLDKVLGRRKMFWGGSGEESWPLEWGGNWFVATASQMNWLC